MHRSVEHSDLRATVCLSAVHRCIGSAQQFVGINLTGSADGDADACRDCVVAAHILECTENICCEFYGFVEVDGVLVDDDKFIATEPHRESVVRDLC